MKIRFAALRVNAQLTQAEAAEKLGISRNTLQKWEEYSSYPDMIQIADLCRIYNCDYNDIFMPSKLAKSDENTKEITA